MDNNEILGILAIEYASLPSRRAVIGKDHLTPERVLDSLVSRFAPDGGSPRFCHGNGQPHIWVVANAEQFGVPDFEGQCAEHPERRVMARRLPK